MTLAIPVSDAHTHVIADITGLANILTQLGEPVDWTDLVGVPSEFPPMDHQHPPGEITGFFEAVDDRVAALLQPGFGIGLNYNDPSGTITISVIGDFSTNLTVTRDATGMIIESSTGSDAELRGASTTQAGVMTAADKTKLDSIAPGAQPNNPYYAIALGRP